MKTHIKHRFSKTEQLELFEYASNNFEVTYLTQEGTDEEGREQWYANNSDSYDNYPDALKGFNMRRESDNPFKPLKTRYSK